MTGDSNGDGELDFEEFVTLIGTMGQGRSMADTTAHVAGPAGNTFPFALVANGYRITQLIDAFDPAVRELLEQRINAGWIGSGDAINHRNVWRSISSTAPRLSRCSKNASSRGRRDRL